MWCTNGRRQLPQTVLKVETQSKYVDTFLSLRSLKSIIYPRHNSWKLTQAPTLLNNKAGYTKGNCEAAMEKLKAALIKFADSNPSLFRHDDFNTHPSLIEQRFSQFFLEFQTPSHPPYAAMIHKAIRELNENRGSSEESISKYIKQEHADLPWAHSTLLKHHLEKLCERKEIRITRKQHYLLPDADSHLISISNIKSGKKNSWDVNKCKKNRNLIKFKRKKKRVFNLLQTNNQVTEDFQEQDQGLPWEIANEKEGSNLIDVCIEQKDEGGVCANDKERIKIQGKKKRKSKWRVKNGRRNEGTQLQDSGEANLKQSNEEIECEKNQGKRVWTKSQIKKMSNMPKRAEHCYEEKQEAKQESHAKLRRFEGDKKFVKRGKTGITCKALCRLD